LEEKKWPRKREAEKQAGKKEPLFDKRLLIALIALVVLWAVFASIAPLQYTAPQDRAEATFRAIAGDQTVLDKTIVVAGGTNAFEAMKGIANVEFQDFGAMGVMVESINRVKPGENEFWGLYVNGEQSMEGISSIAIEDGMLIEWKIESIESYTS
jgi:hypothetical protein